MSSSEFQQLVKSIKMLNPEQVLTLTQMLKLLDKTNVPYLSDEEKDFIQSII